MTRESTNLQNSTNPAITYSECYAQVFLGDCLELYKNIEPKSIDLILTDLPYGTTACKWDTIIPFDKLWEMVNYLLKPNGAFITTASQPFTSALVMSNPKMFKYDWVWNKRKATGHQLVKKQPLRLKEDVLVFYNNQPTYNPQMTEGKPYKSKPRKNNIDGVYGLVGEHRNNNEGVRYPKNIIEFSFVHKPIHPTEKPIALFEYLLKTYSNENMTIFDPCMGSGTTGVACKNLNRNFIGIEKDEDYFNTAKKRIESHTVQSELF